VSRQLFASEKAEKESVLTAAMKAKSSLAINEPAREKRSVIVADSTLRPSLIVNARARSAGRTSETEPTNRLIRSYSLSDAIQQKSKSYLNSIEIYIITEHINKIEQKLAANDQQRIQMKVEQHKKLIQNHRKLSCGNLENPSTSNSFAMTQQLQSAATQSLMTQSTVYGLKRQLALLKARLIKEERLLKQTNKTKEDDEL